MKSTTARARSRCMASSVASSRTSDVSTAAREARRDHRRAGQVLLDDEHADARIVRAERLEEGRPEPADVFVSGHTDDALSTRGRLHESVQLVQKPFTRDGLGQALRRAIASPVDGRNGDG